nr:uncharacterized protein K02A2.6-like [Ipomoea batatas]
MTGNGEADLLSRLTQGVKEHLEYISRIAQVIEVETPSTEKDEAKAPVGAKPKTVYFELIQSVANMPSTPGSGLTTDQVECGQESIPVRSTNRMHIDHTPRVYCPSILKNNRMCIIGGSVQEVDSTYKYKQKQLNGFLRALVGNDSGYFMSLSITAHPIVKSSALKG